MKKFPTRFALLICVISIFFTLQRAQAEIKIGFIGGFSGAQKAYGVPCLNGFQLARKSLPDNFSVIFEDDQFIPAKTVSAFKKLTEIDKVDAIIVLGSTDSNAIAPLAEQKKILTFAWASDQKVSEGHPWVFQTWVTGYKSGRYLATAANKKDIKEIGLIRIYDDHPRAVWDGFKEQFQGKIRSDDIVPIDHQDFTPFILRAKRNKLKTLGLCFGPGQFKLLANQATKLDYSFEIIGCETLDNKNEYEGVAGLNNAWFSAISISENFRSAYLNEYYEDTLIGGAAIHYDLAFILSKLAKISNNSPELRENLLKLGSYKGAITNINIDCKPDCRFDIPLIIKATKN